MKIHEHLISIIILSFNRKEELRNSLNQIYKQSYKNFEIILVDNNSSDGSAKMVEEEFPKVKVINLLENIGIAGWNEGIKNATGDYLLMLDDDSYPDDATLLNGIELLSDNNSYGIVAFRIWNTEVNDFQFNPKGKEGIDFIGCGVMIKKEVFENVGYFNKELFLYEHEMDFSLRVLDYDYKIINSESIVFHKNSPQNRTSARRKYFVARNNLIVLTKYFSFHKVIFRIIRLTSGKLLSGVRQGGFIIILKAIISYFLLLPTLLQNRNVVKDEVQKKYGYGSVLGGFHFKDGDWYN